MLNKMFFFVLFCFFKEAWYSPGRNHRPATGFLEERLRNVRKRLRSGKSRPNPLENSVTSSLVLPGTCTNSLSYQERFWVTVLLILMRSFIRQYCQNGIYLMAGVVMENSLSCYLHYSLHV